MAELLEPRLREVYFREYTMQPLLYTKVFNVQKSTKAFEDVVKVGGFGSLAVKGEGQPVAYDDPVISARKRTIHTVYALGFRVTMEMMDDDLYGVIIKMPKDLADATRDHQENLAWGVFNDAFAGAVHTTIGGDILCQAHALLKDVPNTYSNLQNPAVALSVTGIESLLTSARTMVDESGRFTPCNVTTLVIPPALEFEAARLLETEKAAGEPGTNENQINTVATNRIGVSALVVPYLTDDDAYFLVAEKGKHSLNWFNRREIEWDKGKDFATKDSLFDVMYRAHVTVDDWKGVWGSPG
jgi:phage major head subunit gpT-like protein